MTPERKSSLGLLSDNKFSGSHCEPISIMRSSLPLNISEHSLMFADTCRYCTKHRKICDKFDKQLSLLRQFLEFVTACPRLPHGGTATHRKWWGAFLNVPGLSAAEIAVVPAQPKGSLPRAHTCTNEFTSQKSESVKNDILFNMLFVPSVFFFQKTLVCFFQESLSNPKIQVAAPKLRLAGGLTCWKQNRKPLNLKPIPKKIDDPNNMNLLSICTVIYQAIQQFW